MTDYKALAERSIQELRQKKQSTYDTKGYFSDRYTKEMNRQRSRPYGRYVIGQI